MHPQRGDTRPVLTRVLVAADVGVDPHRLVTLCCERPDWETVSVSLLVPLAAAGGLLRTAAALLDAAGVRVEDFVLAEDDPAGVTELVGSGEFDAVIVCAAHEEPSSPLLALVAQAGRLHGLSVVESGRNLPGHWGWLRRVRGGLYARLGPHG